MPAYGEGPYGAGLFGIGALVRKVAATIRLPDRLIMRRHDRTVIVARRRRRGGGRRR